jgi:hypothetical protein
MRETTYVLFNSPHHTLYTWKVIRGWTIFSLFYSSFEIIRFKICSISTVDRNMLQIYIIHIYIKVHITYILHHAYTILYDVILLNIILERKENPPPHASKHRFCTYRTAFFGSSVSNKKKLKKKLTAIFYIENDSTGLSLLLLLFTVPPSPIFFFFVLSFII